MVVSNRRKTKTVSLVSPFLVGLLIALMGINYYETTQVPPYAPAEAYPADEHEEGRHDNTTTDSHRLLIVQYSASETEGPYVPLLNLTRPINQAYARRFGHDFQVFFGTPFGPQNNGTVPQSRATFNKLHLLAREFERGEYDSMLILDADALIVDFNRDVTSLLPRDKLLVAHRVDPNETDVSTFNINIGISMWNLRHPRMQVLIAQWSKACLERLATPGKRDSDQSPLQAILKHKYTQPERQELIWSVQHDFEYSRGTMVKHYLRPAGMTWTDLGIDVRKERIKAAIDVVCSQFPEACLS